MRTDRRLLQGSERKRTTASTRTVVAETTKGVQSRYTLEERSAGVIIGLTVGMRKKESRTPG